MSTSTSRRLSAAGLVVATTGLVLAMAATPAMAANDPVDEPDSFTSMFTVTATPDMVVGPDGPVAGEPGASGVFNFRINSAEEIICYDIELAGVTPPYESPAITATHVHEAAAGSAGPPRLVFPNPDEETLTSSGCMQGPFETGLTDDATGEDTAAGFSLAQIEADPSAFFADTHTSAFAAGAIRGQLSEMPMGGIGTGGGGTAGDEGSAPLLLGLGALAAAGAVASVVVARRRPTVS